MVRPRPGDRALTVALTDHAARRMRQRRIPPQAVWDAIAHPFVRVPLSGGRQIGAVAAAVGGRWAWVQVVTLALDERSYRVLTVYRRGRPFRAPPPNRP